MEILIDGDACPVKNKAIYLAKKYDLDIIVFIDTSHEFFDNYAKTIQLSKGNDSVDLALVNHAKEDDIVITGDYGLASLALAKKTSVIHFNGFFINDFNIDRLLMQRHLNAKNRRARGRNTRIKKRKYSDDENFEVNLEKLILSSLDKYK